MDCLPLLLSLAAIAFGVLVLASVFRTKKTPAAAPARPSSPVYVVTTVPGTSASDLLVMTRTDNGSYAVPA